MGGNESVSPRTCICKRPYTPGMVSCFAWCHDYWQAKEDIAAHRTHKMYREGTDLRRGYTHADDCWCREQLRGGSAATDTPENHSPKEDPLET